MQHQHTQGNLALQMYGLCIHGMKIYVSLEIELDPSVDLSFTGTVSKFLIIVQNHTQHSKK